MLRIILATVGISLLAVKAVRADPCEGRFPTRPGEVFAETVRYVGDGDSVCVGRTADPNEWIEVRLATLTRQNFASQRVGEVTKC